MKTATRNADAIHVLCSTLLVCLVPATSVARTAATLHTTGMSNAGNIRSAHSSHVHTTGMSGAGNIRSAYSSQSYGVRPRCISLRYAANALASLWVLRRPGSCSIYSTYHSPYLLNLSVVGTRCSHIDVVVYDYGPSYACRAVICIGSYRLCVIWWNNLSSDRPHVNACKINLVGVCVPCYWCPVYIAS